VEHNAPDTHSQQLTPNPNPGHSRCNPAHLLRLVNLLLTVVKPLTCRHVQPTTKPATASVTPDVSHYLTLSTVLTTLSSCTDHY
jgi:hypothetical protein